MEWGHGLISYHFNPHLAARFCQRPISCDERGIQGFGKSQVSGVIRRQTVPHLHIHVIPRRQGEQLRMHAAIKADPAQLRLAADRIRQHLPAGR